MQYYSTNKQTPPASLEEAVIKGLAPDKGLYMPEKIKRLPPAFFHNMGEMSLQEISFIVAEAFFGDDIEADVLKNIVYDTLSFDIPLVPVHDSIYSLELFHGPTLAFKDVGARFMARLLGHFIRKEGEKEVNVLVATSGDTGKAALEGFKDVADTEIMVFYPNDGVSPMQKLQMASQKGGNVHVCAINGNFDDAQTGVKKIFTDKEVAERLNEHNMQFSSANSINWGRLVPQIVYYVSAYCDLLNRGESLENGFNVTVPTGNFGNILAAYYAKKMGVPINKLICASNSNNVLTDFIKTGKYDRNRDFYTTVSPSMDILISSNLERMLFELSGCDDKAVAEMQNELKNSGAFCVSDDMEKKITELFWGGCCDDTQTLETIGNTYKDYGYLCDTHTAVAVNVYGQYVKATGDNRPVVIASTASPYKFADSVLSALTDDKAESDFDKVRQLSRLTSTEIPEPIKALENAEIRFKDVCEKDEMLSAVYSALKI